VTKLLRSVVYLRHAGPNKTFYEGVIRALESALPDVNNGYGQGSGPR
jgi:hypothetical protein